MTKSDVCGATFETVGGTLVCDLDTGHDGPVHSADGEAWSILL